MTVKRAHIIFFSLILASSSVHSQNARFPSSGVIEYEKSINMFAMLKKRFGNESENGRGSIYEEYRKSQPQFKKLNSTLTFSGNKTIFKPSPDLENRGILNSDPMISQNNTVYTDLATGTISSEKKVFEETFLLRDSVRNITWKLTSEMRNIAGYECRRANAVILDSIYVVAFYTDKIPVSGGPESFSGLPGMILGVVLPHENISWFAKSVTDREIIPTAIKAPAKGKPVNHKSFNETIESALKSWGEHGYSAIKAFSL